MRHIQAAAEQKVRAALARLTPGSYPFVDHLDDGTPIAVTVTIAGERATIDFTGTGPVSAGNLNANRAITTAAVLYVLRCLLAEDIPLNQGVLAPVEIIVPPGLLNPPERPRAADCPAVVGGNVETSQRVVDVLLGALGLAAASQGTMNNLLFGDATFGYYETICGGSGATRRCRGADAVHTHMTNTRLTDPEVLERRYPVRLRAFAIRRGSGGAGQHTRRRRRGAPDRVSHARWKCRSSRSGAGPIRPTDSLEARRARWVATRSRAPTARSKNCPDWRSSRPKPGDVLTIETPGGGGFGAG